MTRLDSELGRVQPSVLDAYHANVVSPADIQRAYLRFAWARRKAPARFVVVRWLLAGVAIGLGVASAATLLPPPRVVHSAAPAESTETSAANAKRHAPVRAAQSRVLDEEPTRVEPPPASSVPLAAPQSPRPSSQMLNAAPHTSASASKCCIDRQHQRLADRGRGSAQWGPFRGRGGPRQAGAKR